MYADRNFKTKKALKDAVKEGQKVRVFNPGPFGSPPDSGRVSLEGPHFPAPHSWYASATLKDGVIVSVK